jgi:hypothetical protein
VEIVEVEPETTKIAAADESVRIAPTTVMDPEHHSAVHKDTTGQQLRRPMSVQQQDRRIKTREEEEDFQAEAIITAVVAEALVEAEASVANVPAAWSDTAAAVLVTTNEDMEEPAQTTTIDQLEATKLQELTQRKETGTEAEATAVALNDLIPTGPTAAAEASEDRIEAKIEVAEETEGAALEDAALAAVVVVVEAELNEGPT